MGKIRLKMALLCLFASSVFCSSYAVDAYSFFTQNGMMFRLSPELKTAEFCGVENKWKKTEVIIPDSVTFNDVTYPVQSVIGLTSQFENAEKSCQWSSNPYVKKISIPSTVKYIEHFAFSSYPLVSEIVIPQSVLIVDQLAFYNAVGLKKLVIEDSDSPVWFRGLTKDYSSGYSSIYSSYRSPYSNNFSAEVYENYYSFYDKHWFEDCSKLSEIHIGRNIITKGLSEWAQNNYYTPGTNADKKDFFAAINSISKFEFSNNVTSIPFEIFSDIRQNLNDAEVLCPQKKLLIPASVTKIEVGALGLFKSLDILLEVDSNNTTYSSPSGSNVIVERETGKVVWGGLDAVIPSDAVSIDDLAFFGSGIKELTIPESVNNIGKYAFAFSRNLETVHFADSPVTFGEGTFMQCD